VERDTTCSGYSESAVHANEGQWQDTVQLLRLVQSDFRGVRRQLEQVNDNLAERESLVSQRLQYALQVSEGWQILRLVPYTAGSIVARIGKTTLGEVAQPQVPQKLIRLEVKCLGRFETRSSWNGVERWRSIKAKSVFQYLITRRRQPVVKEVLMEMLWADCDPRAASNNLKAAVHGLRQTLGSLFESNKDFDYVLFLQGSYLINPEIDLWLDVDEFERHWELGQRFDKEQKSSEAIREYEMAEAIYQGDYLEDEPYEEWTLLRREALKDIYLLILGKLADNSMNNGDYDSCVTYSQKILAKDPCREDAYRRLMCCYHRLGQRNRALRWYEICRRIIKAELDTAPDPETSALHHRLIRNDPI